MPRCIHCDTLFARRSWGNPEEPCDCGRMESAWEWRRRHADEREPTEDELEAARAGRARTAP